MRGKVPAKIVLREYLESLLVAVVVALCLRFFVISAYKIPTGSMVPTLKAGDFVFAFKLPYGLPIPFTQGMKIGESLPAHGDVVVFRYPGNQAVIYIKRVVGLPGERIEIRNKKLFVNEVESTYQVPDPNSGGLGDISDLPGQEYYSVLEERLFESSHFVMNRKNNAAGFFGPIVVPPGHIFVLGDNRDSSDDSRYWGNVPLKNLEGRVEIIWMSLDWLERWGNDRFPSVRWERVLKFVE